MTNDSKNSDKPSGEDPTYQLVRQQLLEGTWSGRDDRTPAEELIRRYLTLPAEAAAALALACARALSDPAPRVRAGALYFFASVDDAVDDGALREALLQHATLFQGVPDPYSPGQELFPLLLKVAAARVRPEDRELVSALKQAALIPGGASGALAALIDLDPLWVTIHATDLVQNSPDILKTLLWRLGRRHEAARVVAALLGGGAVPRDQLRAVVESELKGEERERALALFEQN